MGSCTTRANACTSKYTQHKHDQHFFLPRCVHVVAGSAVAAARELAVLASLVSILTAKVPCGLCMGVCVSGELREAAMSKGGGGERGGGSCLLGCSRALPQQRPTPPQAQQTQPLQRSSRARVLKLRAVVNPAPKAATNTSAPRWIPPPAVIQLLVVRMNEARSAVIINHPRFTFFFCHASCDQLYKHTHTHTNAPLALPTHRNTPPRFTFFFAALLQALATIVPPD